MRVRSRHPLQGFCRSINPSGLLEEVWRTLRIAAADVVGYEITDSSLVFIEEYAGVPAPSVQLACLMYPMETRRGRGHR